MAALEMRPSGGFTPVAVVWCRQVDNEAESPGYTTIPEEFPGRRETLETIRLVGNLTVNVADTHDYWDPDPAQTLSYYPNIFLYPAGNGRYTCVGRMFLSTEDRPRLGMKTLVLDTPQLVASGDFGGAVLQAWASMGGRPGGDQRRDEPDASVYQAVGEGFLFHRGTTEPVVIVAAEHWESSIDAMTELVRMLPTSLIALGAFLIFPYFLPEGKVNLHEFAESIPLALAVMRVPEREAQGDRHAKRIQSWEAAPVSLRDLTKPPTTRGKDPLPLVLQVRARPRRREDPRGQPPGRPRRGDPPARPHGGRRPPGRQGPTEGDVADRYGDGERGAALGAPPRPLDPDDGRGSEAGQPVSPGASRVGRRERAGRESFTGRRGGERPRGRRRREPGPSLAAASPRGPRSASRADRGTGLRQ